MLRSPREEFREMKHIFSRVWVLFVKGTSSYFPVPVIFPFCVQFFANKALTAVLKKGRLGEGEVWLVIISINFPLLLLIILHPVS